MAISSRKLLRLLLIIIGGLVCVTIATGAAYVLWPGADTLVINDTNRSISLDNCGDAFSSLPPGDVWDLKPGEQAYIPSGKFQKGNVCDVNYDDVHHNAQSNPYPDACLPLPPRGGGGTIHVSKDLKPYPPNSNDLCDAYIKF